MATRQDVIAGSGSQITGLDPTKTYRSRIATRRGGVVSEPGAWSAEFQPLAVSTDLWSTTFANGLADLAPEVEDGNTAANDSYPGGETLRMAMVVGTRDGHKTRTRLPVVSGAPVSLGLPALAKGTYGYGVVVPAGAPLYLAGASGQDLKTPGVGGVPDAKGGWYTSSGGVWTTDSWSCRVQLRSPRTSWYGEAIPYAFAQAYLYVHHAAGVLFTDQGRPNAEGTIDYGILVTFRNQVTDAPLEFLPGRNDIAMRWEMNTPGANNGKLRMYLNGVLGVVLDDVRFVLADNMPMTQLLTEVFYNGNLPSGTGHSIDFIRPRIYDTTSAPVYTATPGAVGLSGNQATFATGLANWNGTTNAASFTLSHSTDDGGTMRWLTTTAASIGAGSSYNTGADRVAVSPGDTVVGSVDAKQVVGSGKGCRVRVEFYDDANQALTIADDVAWNVTLTSAWQNVSRSIVAPAGAAWARLQPYVQGAAVGDDFRFDNAYLAPVTQSAGITPLTYNGETLTYGGSPLTMEG